MQLAAHHLNKLVQKLESSNFSIQAVSSSESYSLIAKLQQTVFVNELGYPPEAGSEQPDDYEHISTRFIARAGDTPIGTFRLTHAHLNENPSAAMPIETFLNVRSMIGHAKAMEISKFMLLPDYRGRYFCLAMMAYCLAYAEKHHIPYLLATTVKNSDALFEGVGFEAFDKPFFNSYCQTKTTPRILSLGASLERFSEPLTQLKQAKIIL